MKVSELAKRGIGFVRLNPDKPEIVQFCVGPKAKVLFQVHSKGLYDENGMRLEIDIEAPAEEDQCPPTTTAT